MFIVAYGLWLEAGDKLDLATISGSVMSLLATIVPTSAMPKPSNSDSPSA